MNNIPLPKQLNVEEINTQQAVITIEPCYPGYGTTLGNALRRVLLSSLPGAAITAVKFEGVPHEFTTIPFVKEDVIDIILNLKQVRLRCFSDEPVTVTLKAKGAKVVTAADFSSHAQVEVTNPDQVIATLTEAKAVFNLEVTVERGRGYIPVETREKEKLEIGTIAVDALYSPVRTVGMKVENVRVDQFTNYERVSLTVETDGTIAPAAAVLEATKILIDQFNFVATSQSLADYELKERLAAEPDEEAKPAKRGRKPKEAKAKE